MIRKATPHDVPALVELGIEALQHSAYENLVICREKIEVLAREVVSSSAHFAVVSEDNGALNGAVVALSHEMPFYQRRQVDCLMCYCRQPGEGVKLLRELVRWYRSRPIHKMLTFTLDRGMDQRILKLLARLGFAETLPMCVQTR